MIQGLSTIPQENLFVKGIIEDQALDDQKLIDELGGSRRRRSWRAAQKAKN